MSDFNLYHLAFVVLMLFLTLLLWFHCCKMTPLSYWMLLSVKGLAVYWPVMVQFAILLFDDSRETASTLFYSILLFIYRLVARS